MGGCHCSYKNCSVRSDGVTHLFHFPVFHKLRCHKWLVNAGRLEFLNLKVSQLKNRVICQHHFEDDNFMNYMREKLTFNAVPTLDGPFCEPKTSANNIAQEDASGYDISLEDIENEILSLNEKKAILSVKYRDFLTNGASMSDPLLVLNDNKQKQDKSMNAVAPNVFHKIKPPTEKINYHIEIRQNDNIETDSALLQLDSNKQTNTLIPIECNQQVDKYQNQQKNSNKPTIDKPINLCIKRQSNRNSNKKICITSQKTIKDPSSLGKTPIKLGKLEPVSPNLTLHIPQRHQPKIKTNDIGNTIDINNVNITSSHKEVGNGCDNSQRKYQILNETELNQEVPINTLGKTTPPSQPSENKPRIKLDAPCILNNVERNIILTDKNTTHNTGISSPNKKKVPISLLKSKGERVALIEKKRQFNMKLRDMVESCLDKIEPQKKKTNACKEVIVADKNIIRKQPESLKEETFACLEARLKIMEGNLLSKIEQNAQKILHLKNTILPESKKKTIYTQTSTSEEAHKKYLYQEISKYLSPDANSLIYEELFINRYAQKPMVSASPKRRRYR